MSLEMVQEHNCSFMKQRIFVSQSLHYFHKMSGLDYSFDIALERIFEKALATRVEKQHKSTSSLSKNFYLGSLQSQKALNSVSGL